MLQRRIYSEDKRFCLFAIVCSDVWLTDIVNLSAMIAGSDSNLFLDMMLHLLTKKYISNKESQILSKKAKIFLLLYRAS